MLENWNQEKKDFRSHPGQGHGQRELGVIHVCTPPKI